jgi:DMSO/TMAO reductase YedYZ molybdopterin-dependent catalytic subunit
MRYRIPARFTNLALLTLVAIEFATGVGGFATGSPRGAWVTWVHAAAGFGLLLLLPAKLTIAWRSIRRRPAGVWLTLPIVATAVFAGTLATGFAWVTIGLPESALPGVGRVSGLTLHVVLAFALALPLLAHTALRWPHTRLRDLRSRRAALRWAGLSLSAVAAWQAVAVAGRAARLPGADRRFTGSREEGSFAGNAHPVTNWFGDSTRHFASGEWRLVVGGDVDRALALTLEDIATFEARTARAKLDCTGGWYTTQDWTGVPLAAVLARAGVRGSARSIVVRSATGFERRFGVEDAGRLLLATHVGGEPLDATHGAPLRLVAPGRRGYNWVKWITAIEVDARPGWWQWPFPTQ